MSRFSHVPDDLLAAFVDGEVEERVAVHIAEHLDTCPACATRAATMEPLAAAFAAIDDPVVPPDLVSAVLAAAEEPERGPSTELVIGGTLMAAAALLTLLGGGALDAFVAIGMWFDALGRFGEHFAVDLASILVLTTLGAAAGGLVALARFNDAPLLGVSRRLP